ncbi:hypothetical protein M8A51_13005 [Schlegelella sp. S2-27]|uniref:Uncharacterized protein n=1 Tax=Caldimonas mangrovi TaxID=2944811 RepID=A0ABT0YQN9_9BURK|nr:hypothetical protein [Caldimonas mangrovi]MCM5680446.1 hypothetical protein [Caldimonas mangrovi]
MPFYQCPSCMNIVDLPQTQLKPKVRVECPACGDTSITATCLAPHATQAGMPPKPANPNKKRHTGMVGRSNAAPSFTSWPLTNQNTDVTYVADLSTPAWTAAGQAIRLPYQRLDIGNTGMQGLVIALPELTQDTEAQKHFAEITRVMVSNHRPTDATEGTGEAAAAMAMLKEHAGFKMRWGFHGHSGPGIDQIWVKEDTRGRLAEVLIVEAKGPGASESENPFMPPGFEQMSARWIVHNLTTMMNAAANKPLEKGAQGALASAIVKGLGLRVGVTYPKYENLSKSYYGVIAFEQSKKSIKLRRITVAAQWQSDGMLGYTKTEKPELTRFEPTDRNYHDKVRDRYPQNFQKDPPEVTF